MTEQGFPPITKKHLYVTQLGVEQGHDMAWSDWLVLAHDDSNDGKAQLAHRELDRLLCTVNVDFEVFADEHHHEKHGPCSWLVENPQVPGALLVVEDNDESIREAWIAYIRPLIEALGFEWIGMASYIFNGMQPSS